LHCASLFGPDFPEGDKGGNSFYVKPAKKGVKLHSLWDGLLGMRNHPQTQLNDALRIRSEHPRDTLAAQLESGDAPVLHKQWSLEGRKLAIDKAYLRGKLKNSAKTDPGGTLPKDYMKDAKVVAEKQAALAGYRLADEIEQLVK
jgi:hypothetical protein